MSLMNKSYCYTDLPEMEEQDYSPIPPGSYDVEIQKVSLEDTKAGNGKYLKLMVKIINPKYVGRLLFTNITVSNPNPVAEEIGEQKIMTLVRAGKLENFTITNRQMLVGVKFNCTVELCNSEWNGTITQRNEIKYFRATLQYDGNNDDVVLFKNVPQKQSNKVDELNPPEFDDEIPF